MSLVKKGKPVTLVNQLKGSARDSLSTTESAIVLQAGKQSPYSYSTNYSRLV